MTRGANYPLHGLSDVAFRIAWFGVGALAFRVVSHRPGDTTNALIRPG
jgi:hypothetical protein